MSVTKDFDAMLAEQGNIRPTFKVAGQEFTMRARLPYARWNKLIAVMRADGIEQHEATVKFFDTVLIKADRDRFRELLEDDPDEDDANVLDLTQMNALTDWAMEFYMGKLQSSSPSSSPGANGTGAPANVVSLNPRTTAS